MTWFVGKAHELVFDTRAIPRPHPADLARIHGGLVQVLPDDPLRFGCRIGHPTGDLFAAWFPSDTPLPCPFHVAQVFGIPGVVEGKKSRLGVSFLLLEPSEIDAPAQDPGWRSGLQALELDAGLQQAAR